MKLTTTNLASVLEVIGKLPSAQVVRAEDVITVNATLNETGESVTFFSAERVNNGLWLVRADNSLLAPELMASA